MVVVRHAVVILVAGTFGFSWAALGQTPSDPPSRVGRLAHVQGTVSFHDTDRPDWEPATINRPLTAGDSLWTEPNSRAELSISGTQIRMDGASQLDLQALDEQLTRMQLSQGRVDIKTFNYDTKQPYELVTPRGIATLQQQQGDYYVQAGSTQDPTRLGVRKGAAQFQAPDGRVLAVRAGEVAEISGDGSDMKLVTIQSAPPPVPQYWAQRDRIVSYDQPPQYLSAGVTGYEDLNHYGTWQNDAEYGQVWYARDVPQGWQPYSTGRWSYEPVYGWTWIDEQPWGFAPYHYGRWGQRNNRWFWVPPERSQPAVYAPALVAFIGGTELGIALGVQNRRPVGWFPLGPREVYVPPYTNNRDYYRRLNMSARIQDRMLEDRWDRMQRREAIPDQNWMNRRFATVVPADAFARSQRVENVRLRIQPDRIASVPVASVAVPPSPTVSVRALTADQAQRPDRDGRPDQADRQDRDRDGRPDQANRQDRDRDGRPDQADRQDRDRDGRPDQANRQDRDRDGRPDRGASAALAPAMMQAIKPEPQQQKAPGPQIVSRTNATANTDTRAGAANEPGKTDANKALPQLAPRNAKAAAPPQIQGERKPAATEPGSQATAPADRPATRPGEAARPNEPTKPGESQANAPTNQPTRPGEPPKANEPPKPGERANAPAERAQPGQPGQANLPAVRDRNNQRPEPPKPDQQADTKPNAPAPNAAQPQKPGEPPKPAAPQASKPDEAPKPPQAQVPQQRQATPQPQRQAEPQPQRQAEPPKPPQAQTPAPQRQAEPQQRQAEPPKPQQATPPAPQQRPPQAQPQQRERETRAAPPQQPQAAPQPQPQPQRQASPPPQAQPQQQRQAAPQQQHQQPQQQAQQPRPQPQQQAQPQPQRQAAPQQQQHQQPQQQAQQPKPQQQQAQQKDDKKN